MPFKSEAQRRYLWANEKTIAKKWSHEYPGQHDLPEHVKKKKKHTKTAEVLGEIAAQIRINTIHKEE